MPPSYNAREYWNERFAAESSFEWLLSTAATKSIIAEQLDRIPDSKTAKILHIGCGNSDLSHELPDLVDYRGRICNVDFSLAVIEAAREKAHREGTCFRQHAPPESVPHLISTQQGTDPAVFDAWLHSIGMKNEGPIENYPGIPWQSQVIDLTPAQAADAKAQPFMFVVSRVEQPLPCDRPCGQYVTNPVEARMKLERANREYRVQWLAVDLLCPDALAAELLEQWSAFPTRYDVIVDKSTSDSIACGDDVTVTLPYPIVEGECSSSDKAASPLRTVSIHPIHLLSLHMAAMAKGFGSRWLVFSYSEHRFPFLTEQPTGASLQQQGADEPLRKEILDAGFPDPSKLWRLEAKWSVEVPCKNDKVSSGPVHRPPELCWVYILERTAKEVRWDPNSREG